MLLFVASIISLSVGRIFSIKSYQTDNDIILATKRSIFGNYSRERQVKRQYFYLTVVIVKSDF
jgi:hypothetical protein